MRRAATLIALVALCALAGPGAAQAAAKTPSSGFYVYKDMRDHGVTEVRDAATGRVVASETSFGKKDDPTGKCSDSHHKFFGARWKTFEPWLVQRASIPAYLDADAAIGVLQRAHEAWETPLATPCAISRTSHYRSVYGGVTTAGASLADGLTRDALNVVEFRNLDGTVCAGARACVIAWYKGSTIEEADVLFEADLTRSGYQDFWTTADETVFDDVGGEFALVDTATHEWGHFAGLDHVDKSPGLTMYPRVNDASQSLGLGDVKGIAARYGN